MGALLSLARPPAAPVDLYETLRPIAVLYEAVARAEAGALTVDPAPVPPALTVADGDAARLALAAALDVLVQADARVRGTVRRDGGAAVVTLVGTEPALPPAEVVRRALAAEGITMETGGAGITIRFPAPAGQD